MICPSCGRAVPDGSRYCPKCGIDLSRLKNGVFCHKCGAKLSSAKGLCPLCGTPVKESVQDPAGGWNTGKSAPEADRKRQSSGSAPNTAGEWEFINDNNPGSSSSRSRSGDSFQHTAYREKWDSSDSPEDMTVNSHTREFWQKRVNIKEGPLPEGFWEDFEQMFKNLSQHNSSGNGSSVNISNEVPEGFWEDFEQMFNNLSQHNSSGNGIGSGRSGFNANNTAPEELQNFLRKYREYIRQPGSSNGKMNGNNSTRDFSGAGFDNSFASEAHTGKEQHTWQDKKQDNSQTGFADNYADNYTDNYADDNASNYSYDKPLKKDHAEYNYGEYFPYGFTSRETEELRELNRLLDNTQTVMIIHIIAVVVTHYLSLLSLCYLAFTAPPKIRQAEYFLRKCGYTESVRLCRRELKTMVFFKILAPFTILASIVLLIAAATEAATKEQLTAGGVLCFIAYWLIGIPLQVRSFMTFGGIKKDLNNLLYPEWQSGNHLN